MTADVPLEATLPTSLLIYTSSQVAIDETQLLCLATLLLNQVVLNRFCGSDESAPRLLELHDRDIDIDELMTATTVVEAHSCTPDYGQKYELGDYPEPCVIIEFLRKRVVQSKVWRVSTTLTHRIT